MIYATRILDDDTCRSIRSIPLEDATFSEKHENSHHHLDVSVNLVILNR